MKEPSFISKIVSRIGRNVAVIFYFIVGVALQ